MAEFLADKSDKSRVDLERTGSTGYNGSTIDLPSLFAANSNINTVGRFDQNSAPAQVYERNRDSVAHIHTFDGTSNGSNVTTDGSGFFVTQDGLLATDYHVIKDAKGRINVTTSDGRVHQADIVDVDTTHDLALLQVQPVQQGESFKPVVLGSSQVNADQTVTALGFPRTSDILHVSPGNHTQSTSLARYNLTGGLMPGEDPNRRVLSSEMNVQKGNSGGPLFDASGRVAGIIDLSGSKDNVPNTLAVSTPVEDVINLINHSRRNFQQAPNYVADNGQPYYGPQTGNSYYPTDNGFAPGNIPQEHRFQISPERQQQMQREWGNFGRVPGPDSYRPEALPQLPRVSQNLASSPMQVLDAISSLQTLQGKSFDR